MQGDKASNFGPLKAHDQQLVRLGMLAERYFADDPNTCLLKLRQLTELLAQLAASNIGVFTSSEEKQVDLLRRLQDQRIVPREVGALLAQARKSGNNANHRFGGDHRTALRGLRLTWQLGVWFHRTFKDPAFKSGPFLPLVPPAHESLEIKAELDALQVELAQYCATHQDAAQVLDQAQAQSRRVEEDRAFWENMATEAESARSELLQQFEVPRAQANAELPPQAIARLVAAANSAAAVMQISEGDTRKLIDEQLAVAGWTVDSARLTFAKGARPQRDQNLAIAEWPTEPGPADYALFVGVTPVAIAEAKRKNLYVSAALQQAKRYSRGFRASIEVELPADNFGANAVFRIPFVFSTNGRPYLRQSAWRQALEYTEARLAQAHRGADQGQHARGPRRARRLRSHLQTRRRRLHPPR